MVEIISPSGRYKLVITQLPRSHSRGQLYAMDNTLIADIERNYCIFSYSFQTKDGQEYLITGRNYMGQTIINCDEGWEVSTSEGYTGYEFCWSDHWLSPDGKTLAVEGCHWACPYQLKFFDFSNPRVLPLPELEQGAGLVAIGDCYEVPKSMQWIGDVFCVEGNVERRKLDGKIYAGVFAYDMTAEQTIEIEEELGQQEEDYFEYVDAKIEFSREGNRIIRKVILASSSNGRTTGFEPVC